MGLQVIYLGLAAYGWLNWLFGGARRSTLAISRTTAREWIILSIAVPAGTWGLRVLLLAMNGSAPLGDAVTTTLSLGAQYLLCRKRLENWWLWIAADVIYVPLYIGRGLLLTAVLYAVFLAMCLIGIRAWSQTWRSSQTRV
jgi:nicotinamide mononucleotide transporter